MRKLILVLAILAVTSTGVFANNCEQELKDTAIESITEIYGVDAIVVKEVKENIFEVVVFNNSGKNRTVFIQLANTKDCTVIAVKDEEGNEVKLADKDKI